MKIYFSGVAGTELESYERMKRGQVDGVISGGIVCERLAPSVSVMRIPGLFQSRAENAYVLGRLKPVLDKEFLAAGVTNLFESGVGPDLVFTRRPVRSMAELKALRLWIWDIDQSLAPFLKAMGLNLFLAPINEAGRAYDEGKHDGFIVPASAALVWQWTPQVHFFTNLNLSYVSGCFLIASRAFDALPIRTQEVIRTSGARARSRMDVVMQDLESQLVGGLFQKQGLTESPVSDTFRSEFFAAARAAREQATGHEVPQALIARVLSLLADFRAVR
jgi:TRAP-type C4-dicarboxylate transport system substrate-binding protein